MLNLLPAVLIGGPPHAGKSVLFYSLTRALRMRGIAHHAVRACPDGEGNWSQEVEQEEVRLLRVKGKWSTEFVERVSQDIARRLLPMLIDMGGRPNEQQEDILRNCTHAILLLRDDEPESQRFWVDLVERNGILTLARITSLRVGSEEVRQREGTIDGAFVGIERGHEVDGSLFDLLVERLASLFSASKMEHAYLEQAPTGLMIQLPQLLQTLAPGATEWRPELLPAVLNYIPVKTAIAVYGHGPHWLLGALIAHTGGQDFFQFDPRGPARSVEAVWIAPPVLRIGEEGETEDVEITRWERKDYTRLAIEITVKHLDYLQVGGLAFPDVRASKGLVLDGSLPSWLVTALVRLYEGRVEWIGCYQPRLKGAVIVAGGNEEYGVGKVVGIERGD